MNIFSLLTLKLCLFPCWEVRGSWLSAANHIVCLHSLETEALYFSFPHPALWSQGCVFSVIECQVGFRSRNQNMNGLNESCAPLWCPLFKADVMQACRLRPSRGSVNPRLLLVHLIRLGLQPCSHPAGEWRKRWRKKGHDPPCKVLTRRQHTSLPVIGHSASYWPELVTWPHLAARRLGNVVLLWKEGRMVLGDSWQLCQSWSVLDP